MKKLAIIGAVFALALTVGVGMAVSGVQAKPPDVHPATYKCINNDTYFCVLYFNGGVMYEVCEWYATGCQSGDNWYCKTVLGQEYACHMVGDTEECIWHPYGCP